ncbi:MAG: hypothetical protein ACRDOU_01345 [Streptosporangiaceae bacterium]
MPVKMANSPMMIAAMTVWVTEAMCGLFHLGWVRPSAFGARPSRPSPSFLDKLIL